MEIEPTNADEREIIAALLMDEVLRFFGDDTEMAALVALVFRGNDRVLASKMIPLFLQSLAVLGKEDTWQIFAAFGAFRHIDMPIIPDLRLNLNSISQSDCKETYRFDQDELRRIIPMLPLPDYIITPEGDRAHLIEAFALVLRRMSNRGKIHPLIKDFGRSIGSLCRIIMYTTHLILQRVGRSVFFYPVTLERLIKYRDAFRGKGVPDNLPIVAVLDNKKQFTSKPTHNEQSQYNRFKKGHGPKHQHLHAPDGMVLHSYPGDGRPHDASIERESNLSDYWRTHPLLQSFKMLSDSGYGNSDCIVAMYKRRRGEAALPLNRRLFNSRLAPSRTMGVENDFSLIISNWPFLDNRKVMKMEKSPVISYWALGVWLTNLLTCTREGNQIASFFDCGPPTLVDFIHDSMY